MRKFGLFVAGLCLTATAALGVDGEPGKAGKFQATLVNVYPACTTPTESTNGTLALPACPAVDPALCTFGDKGKGSVAAKTKTDVSLQVKIGGLENCPDGTVLQATASYKSATNDCTVSSRCATIAIPAFAIPGATCTVDGGKCQLKTTINTLIPGAITPGQNTSVIIGDVGIVAGTVGVAAAGVLVP